VDYRSGLERGGNNQNILYQDKGIAQRFLIARFALSLRNGIFPIRASPLRIISHTSTTLSSKSPEDLGRFCQTVGRLPPNSLTDLSFGKIFLREGRCSAAIATQTPLSAACSFLSRRISNILSP